MDKEKYQSSLARLALIAAGGTAAVVMFTGGIASAQTAAAHPERAAVVATATTADTTAATPAARYVTRLLSATDRASVPVVYSQQYTQELPFMLIFDQVPPFGQS